MYYRLGSHRLFNLNHCPVLDPRLDALIPEIKSDLESTSWVIDSDFRGEAGLRHLGLRIGVRTGEVLISLVSATEVLPGIDALSERWMKRWPQVKGVTLNLQPRRSNTVLGETTVCLQGKDAIDEQFCGLKLELGTTTFFQVNTARAERAVELICDWLSRSGEHLNVIDAYCGIGTIALPMAAQGHSVTGLELSSASIRHAQRNASRNNLHTTEFIDGDVILHLQQLLPHHDALVVDPPRKGLSPEVLAMILQQPPQRLAYLSCDPATLARDLRDLAGDQGPYRIERSSQWTSSPDIPLGMSGVHADPSTAQLNLELLDQRLAHLVVHRLNLLIGEGAVFAAIPQTECLAALVVTELTAFEAIDQIHRFQQGLARLTNGLQQVA